MSWTHMLACYERVSGICWGNLSSRLKDDGIIVSRKPSARIYILHRTHYLSFEICSWSWRHAKTHSLWVMTLIHYFQPTSSSCSSFSDNNIHLSLVAPNSIDCTELRTWRQRARTIHQLPRLLSYVALISNLQRYLFPFTVLGLKIKWLLLLLF